MTVHCNHGKGRTGTCIIAFMLYAREFSTAEEALTFYNKKRRHKHLNNLTILEYQKSIINNLKMAA